MWCFMVYISIVISGESAIGELPRTVLDLTCDINSDLFVKEVEI